MIRLARRAPLLVAFSVLTSVVLWMPPAWGGEVAPKQEPMLMEKWSQLSLSGRLTFAAGVIDGLAMLGFTCSTPVTLAEVAEGLRAKWRNNMEMRTRFTAAFVYALGDRGCRFTDPDRTHWLNQQMDAERDKR